MHSLLSKLLQKREIKHVDDLDKEEKGQFIKWQTILTGEQVTVDKIGLFIKAQIISIESQMKNLDNTPQKNERLILLFSVYKAIGEALKAPEKEREVLENYLRSLLTEK
jgi:hypothetical protein